MLAPLAAQAQQQSRASARPGVKLGLTFTNFGGDDVDAIPFTVFENKLGFATGAMVELPLSTLVSLQPEMMVVSKGADVEVLGEPVGHISLRYFQIPILFRLRVPAGDSVAPFLVAGPGLGILLTARSVNNDGDTDDLKDNTNDLDLGLILGGGINVPLSSGAALEIEFRYERGLVSIDDNPDDNGEADIYNSAILVLGGYRF